MPSVFWYASPHLPFTVLKRFYINTVIVNIYSCVAISPTVYGIETYLYQSRTRLCMICCNSTYRLRYWNLKKRFTVDFLRLCCNSPYRLRYWNLRHQRYSSIYLGVATVLTVYGIETRQTFCQDLLMREGCNSTYRLRYALKGARQQRSKATMRSAHLKCLSKAKAKQRWWSNTTYRLWYWNINWA